MELHLLTSDATGLVHVFGPGMTPLGAVGRNPAAPSRWSIAYGKGGFEIEFETQRHPTRAAAVAALVTSRKG